MKKQDFLKILQASILLFEGTQPYELSYFLDLNEKEKHLAMEVFKMLRFENVENIEVGKIQNEM